MASELPGLRRRVARPEQGVSRGFPAVRLLPAVIFAAVAMLGVRVEVVVETIAHARHASIQVTPQIAVAQAQTPTQTAAAPAAAEKPAEGEAASKGEDKAEGKGSTGGFDASKLTPSEIDMLQRLSERREQIEKREQEVAAREAVLKAGEARIDGKVVQLQDLEKSIKSELAKYDTKKQAEIDNLVKIYAAMKPKDAATIFDGLDMPILLAVAQTMPVAKVAPIMAAMKTEKARQLTEELSQRKQFGQAN